MQAGANVNEYIRQGVMFPAVAYAMFNSKQEEVDEQILEILIGRDRLCTQTSNSMVECALAHSKKTLRKHIQHQLGSERLI